MRRWKGTLTGGVIALVVMAYYYLGNQPTEPETAGGGGSSSYAAVGDRREMGREERARADLGGAQGSGEAGGGERADAPEDEAARALADELRRRIREARRVREGEPPRGPVAPSTQRPGADPGDHEEHGTLDPEYIRDAVAEVVPLLQECYELALEQEPTLAGSLVVEFDIEGEPEVGGVVEDTSIDEASTIGHPLLDECITETMYTLELPAPEGGGMVHVRYPLNFSSGSNEGEGEGEGEGATRGRSTEEAPP